MDTADKRGCGGLLLASLAAWAIVFFLGGWRVVGLMALIGLLASLALTAWDWGDR